MVQYDAVVVGAGNAGLSAAIRLQLAGVKTLLIEQHNLPGGCATSFRRGRFEIEPSLHELCDIGSEENPGEIRKLFDEYGVKLDWVACPDCFRVISKYSDGTPMDVTMPDGIDAFIEKMEHYVPGSSPKMRELFDLYEEIRQGAIYTSNSNGKADPAYMKEHFPNMLRTGAYPVNKVFKAMKLPQKCQDILSTYWGYLGVDMDRLSFFHYASMMQRICFNFTAEIKHEWYYIILHRQVHSILPEQLKGGSVDRVLPHHTSGVTYLLFHFVIGRFFTALYLL